VPEPVVEPTPVVEPVVEPVPVEEPAPTAVDGTQPSTVLRFVIDQIQYTHNGASRNADAAPFIANGRTMVPLRVIGEALGAEIAWDGATSTATLTLDGESVSVTIGTPLPNDMGTPVIASDRTFVPLAFVAQSLGAAVEWDGDARAVYVRN
jgi:hypothetical protein